MFDLYALKEDKKIGEYFKTMKEKRFHKFSFYLETTQERKSFFFLKVYTKRMHEEWINQH